ncbi:MAG: amino acid adenylation domain-containing protein, partial [bacterium]|nr:amino acid adenylation domain-containing protein [bacterium]
AEASVYTSVYPLARWNKSGAIPIGMPIDNTKLYIAHFINGEAVLLPRETVGELCIAGIGVARGYLGKPQLSDEKFIQNPFEGNPSKDSPYKTLFRTGELGRVLPDGNIEYLGRIDRQVEVKGHRVNRGEIENYILGLEEISDAVVVARQDESGIYFCAYIVAPTTIDTSQIRDKLSEKLPHYMVPAYFLQIRKIPLTPDGRADRGELLDIKHDPHQIENILAEIEAEVLHMDKMDIHLDDNFLLLGGHSYKAAQMASKIHKVLNVKVSMTELFKRPTLRQLSEFLTESIEEKYAAIQPAEPLEYYPQSAAQRRLYFLQQLEEDNIVYNIQMMDIYCKGIEKERLEESFRMLIERHESLRTSFQMIDGKPVQKIHDYEEVGANFNIEYYESTEEGKIYAAASDQQESEEGVDFQEVIQGFVRPFDFNRPLLLRVGFIRILGDTKILVLDMHHIIADGISMEILAKELWEVYDGKELPPLRIQYKDFSQWLNSEDRMAAVKEQEAYWLNEFSGDIPLINLPTDFPRPAMLNFEGDILDFEIGRSELNVLNLIARAHGETLYMVLFAIYNVFLAKLTGQEDIVVGTVTAGRGHTDLEPIVGMFLNTLALRNYPLGEMRFEDFLMEVKVSAFAAFENQDYPFDQLVSQVAPRQDTSRNPLFDVAFGLENEADPTGYLMEVAIPDKSKPYDFGTKKSKFDLSLVCIETEGGMECSLEYKTRMFKQTSVQRFAGYFKKIITSVCGDLYQKISDIEIISDVEKKQILQEFNDTQSPWPSEKLFHELLEDQVEKAPGAVAIQGKCYALPGSPFMSITYGQLNRECNRLAKSLRAEGVGRDSIVGIITHPSVEMFVAMFAIMKAGGGYLPLDPTHPEERIEFTLDDSGTKVLLYTKDVESKTKFPGGKEYTGHKIALESKAHHQEEFPNLEHINKPCDLVYVIYTSGTTGKPKGVMTEHSNVVSYIHAFYDSFDIKADDAVVQQASYTFDVFVEEVYPVLMRGGRISIPGKEKVLDIDQLSQFIARHRINIIDCTPLLLNEINKADLNLLKSMHTFISGGDVLKPTYVDKLIDLGKVWNTYGPTEATVCVTYYEYTKKDLEADIPNIPIGKPISNYKAFILDKNEKLQPVGFPGELCASGVGVARGYLSRPELTAEKFIENPYRHGDMLYRTGDLARWLPDGNIEYAGRIDHQVKIRGYRIELGEIETHLARHNDIKEAVVLAVEAPTGLAMAAYFLADREIATKEIRDYLSEDLPPYMIPSYFMRLEKFPETATGKVDRKALPDPVVGAISETYIAPRTAVEKQLSEVWQEVLGVEQVGIEDDFFSMGGDSIKSIQIVSKLQKKKLKLEVSRMFAHKTIRELSKHVKSIEVTRKIEQGVVEGNVPMTPIQHWLFTGHSTYCNHFNQSVRLFRKTGFDENLLKTVFTKLVQHHDALRMTYKKEADGFTQFNRGLNGDLFHLDTITIEKKDQEETIIKREANRLQSSIDLSRGPLLKLGLFKGTDGDHLVIVVHHLVVDGISWRILTEDFETAYMQAEAGKTIALQEKTDTFKSWAEKQVAYAESKPLLREIPVWKRVEEGCVEKLPVDQKITKEKRNQGNLDILPISLDKKHTDLLLTGVNHAYNTEINDVLLTALGLTVKEWSGSDNVLIDLEGHGREEIIENMDINRTVGWFTTQYPIILNMADTDISHALINTKETLRRIPSKGIGYGMLRFITPNEKKEDIQFKLEPEILFNYLGQFGGDSYQVVDEMSQLFDSYLGDSISPHFEVDHKIDIEGLIVDGKLNLYFFYNKHEYDKKNLEKLAGGYIAKLEEVIRHCREKKEIQSTPSDLGCSALPIETFRTISADIEKTAGKEAKIKSIYPLTSMQRGLLAATQDNREAYFVQMVFFLPPRVNKEKLEESLNMLAVKHEVFRTLFFHLENPEPLQIVLDNHITEVTYADLSHTSAKEKESALEELMKKDRNRGFQLSADFPMRAIYVKTGEKKDKLVWSFHNLCLDGWSIGIFLKDFITIYEFLMDGEKISLESDHPYKDYIDWLVKQDLDEGMDYWQEYFSGYKGKSLLSGQGKKVEGKKYNLKEYSFTLDESLSDGLNRLAAKSKATLNVLCQTMWGVLLQKYTGENDILFGAIVSGRSAGVEGIENIVGVFTNMIPIRIRAAKAANFYNLLQENQQKSIALKKYEHYPLTEVLADSSLTGGDIDTAMFFQNYQIEGERFVYTGERDSGFKLKLSEYHEQLGHDFNIFLFPDRPILFRFGYNSLVFDETFINELEINITKMTKQIIENPEILIRDITVTE